MEEMKLKLERLREERMGREKARLDKLRELNLKKYKIDEKLPAPKSKPKKVAPVRQSMVKSSASNSSVSNPIKNAVNKETNFNKEKNINKETNINKEKNINKETNINKEKNINKSVTVVNKINVKTNKDEVKVQLNGAGDSLTSDLKKDSNVKVNSDLEKKTDLKQNVVTRKSMIPNVVPKVMNRKSMVPSTKVMPKDRKSLIPLKGQLPLNSIQVKDSRRTLMPQINETKESVFDRLYKPKMVKNRPSGRVDGLKLQNDAKFKEKIIKQSNMLLNKRHTIFDAKTQSNQPVRRSISAVHFKRIGKSELSSCFHKWASSENVNKLHLKGDEDEGVTQDKVVSAIKSDRKKVNFKKPISMNFNTPKPEELQSRLKEWLLKRGKSLDRYHHLQCFGLHHMAQSSLTNPPQTKHIDEENKENIAEPLDSDNESYSESMGQKYEQKWRRASAISSADFNETKESLEMSLHSVDDLVVGALNDLTDLLREGFDWEQSARWLRAIRERFPSVSDTASYWECRAALEERQGNLPASVHCWEEAIAKGTERSVVEANLDQLLDKFMQLKISPRSAKKEVNPKMVDVKNVFKSTIIRFAVQQAKIRQSAQHEQPRYTITPVRRSGRVSTAHCGSASMQKLSNPNKEKFLTPRGRKPLVQICSSVRQFREAQFVPNGTLPSTP